MKGIYIYRQLKEDTNYLTVLVVYVFIFLFFCSKMSPLYPINEWSDINVYFNVGKGMFSGMTLYSEIFDHKGPLIFIIYGIGSLFSSNSLIGMFIIQVVAWIVAVIAVYYTAKILLKKESAFLIALIAPLSFLNYVHTGGSAEETILILAIISLYFFISFFTQKESKHKPYYMFVHGAITAMVFLIKLNLILFWFFPLLAIFISLLLKKKFKNFLQNCLAFLLGAALIVLPISLYFLYNGALSEAYYVYIELNKLYSSTENYGYLITNGFSKLYKEYRAYLVWYIIITVGIFYFPIRYIKGWAGRVALTLSGISLILFIFFPLTFHFYYPLPLFVFTILGLIALFAFLEKYITLDFSKKVMWFIAITLLFVAINKRDFFGMGGDQILRKSAPHGPQFHFKDIVLKEKNPTLLNIAFGEGNALFTTTGITPTVKYFFCPNIYYGMFPEIRDEQTKYIENKETQFVVSSNMGFNYDYFIELEALKNNYTMIDSCVMTNEYIKDRFTTYYLYKRNN